MNSEQSFESGTLQSLPVVAVNEGRILGRVKDLVFDPAAHTMIGLTFSGGNGRGDFIDADRIGCLGPHAIIVATGRDVTAIDDHARASEVVASGIRVRGADVITDTGRPLGKLDKVWMREDGSVLRYQASMGGWGFGRSQKIDPEDIVVIGEDVAIVSSDAVDGPRQSTPVDRNQLTADD